MNIRGWLAVSLVVLSFAFPVVAQERISQEVWDGYHRIAYKILHSMPYRTKITVDNRKTEEEEWQLSGESVVEHIYPNLRYFKGKYLETIKVGNLIYRRKSNGEWQVGDLSQEKSVGTAEVVERISDEFSRELAQEDVLQTRIRDGNSTVLTREIRAKVKYMRDGTIIEQRNIRRVWFDQKGQFERTEVITYEPHRQVFLRTTEVFEYDPNIKIEAPIK